MLDRPRLIMDRDIVCFFDGDSAGKLGSDTLKKRLNVFGKQYFDIRPEAGDPKNLSLEDIYARISGLSCFR